MTTHSNVRRLSVAAGLIATFAVALVGGYAVAHTNAYFGNDNGQTCPTHDHRDECHMRGGGDRAFGQGDNDALHMGDGDDRGAGEGNNDNVYGGNGQDTLTGDSSEDDLDGEGGGDYAEGNQGVDNARGGENGDTVVVRNNDASDTANGGNAGNDICHLDFAFGIAVDFHGGGCEAIVG